MYLYSISAVIECRYKVVWCRETLNWVSHGHAQTPLAAALWFNFDLTLIRFDLIFPQPPGASSVSISPPCGAPPRIAFHRLLPSETLDRTFYFPKFGLRVCDRLMFSWTLQDFKAKGKWCESSKDSLTRVAKQEREREISLLEPVRFRVLGNNLSNVTA